MNLLLKNTSQMKFHTDMKGIFSCIETEVKKYNWLITDLECNYIPDTRLRGDNIWISGEDLFSIIGKYDDLQFIWAVFSAFPTDVLVDISDDSSLPYADGNKTLWNKDRKPQHKESVIEIVCWDSSETIFTSENYHMLFPIMKKYSDAIEL